MLHKTDKCTRVVSMVTTKDWAVVCQDVKNQCTSIANGLILKLDKRFLAQEFMNAIGIVYPQYWVQPKVALMFPTHL
jgi:hypothetical protein